MKTLGIPDKYQADLARLVVKWLNNYLLICLFIIINGWLGRSYCRKNVCKIW